MNLDDALKTYVIESRELLEQMEDALLQLEQHPTDADLINAIFRAAHTIKGSAGLFGLDFVVSFTHIAENVLDRLRSAELAVSNELIALFLKVRDHIGVLIDLVEAASQPDEAVDAQGKTLVEQLKAISGQAKTESASPPAHPMHATQNLVREDAPDTAHTDNWHLSLRFNRDVLKNGMDPLAFIRYLTTFGRITAIVTLVDELPRAAEMDPECSYFGYEIGFQTDADKSMIENAFEFVRNDAQIRILPPHSKVTEYLSLIDNLSDEELRLGEILVRCGTLSHTELEAALTAQDALRRSKNPEESSVLGEVLVAQNVVRPAVVEAALQKQKQVKETKSNEAGLIRVNAETLDKHINLIGELIIASAGISLNAQRSAVPELLEAASILTRLVEEVRDSALKLRMVEIGATFHKFQRMVRDVSKEIGKDIRLEISGADTDLDKTVVEKIGDPLTHLVRNSMDHGIEPAELRLERGKPAYGTLRLNAFHDSGSIVIEVADDGGGLNRNRIHAKAIERGVIKPDQQLSDDEIHDLIFEPGFSTAETVNNLSGRGVGMDVVRRNITALRGSIEIDSEEGEGTTMRIRLPLTLAIIDGFLVGVGASAFVVPLDMVIECVELSQEELDATQGRDHLNLRGEVLPFIRLKQFFDVPEAPEPSLQEENGLLDETEADSSKPEFEVDPELAFLLQPVKRNNVVVVHYAGRRAGLVVDSLMGEFQTVIRPLGEVFNGLQGISGFTLLGNGQVALILDVPGLVRRVTSRETHRNQRASTVTLLESVM